MDYSWILPAAETLYKNRDDIQSNFQKVSNWLVGNKSTIVITGLPGVGKTVLSDYLTDVAYKRGYTSPLKSEDVETRKTTIEKQRLDFKVVPGQTSPQRNNTLDNIFNSDERSAVDGVIHVVANGLSRTKDEFPPQRIGNNLQAYRDKELDAEIDDLSEICELIRKSFRNTGKPAWLLVAVTKVDLYYDVIETARDRYSI